MSAAPARKLALIGARAAFTATVLSGLLARAEVPVALALHAPSAAGSLPVRRMHEVDRMAEVAGIAVHDVTGAREALAVVQASGAALAVVACYPRRLPVDVGTSPPHGLYNLHPSPLPAFRGPSPLFWQLRSGANRTAVSLHRVNAAFDAGAVLARDWLPLAPGDRFEQVNAKLADLGAGLVLEHLLRAPRIAEGEAQCEARASEHRAPEAADFAFTPDWPAERVYRFVAGTAAWGRSFRVYAGGAGYHVDGVLGFERQGLQSRAVLEARGERLWIRCRPGVVQALGGRLQ